MTTETPQQSDSAQHHDAVEGERGFMLAMLVMVLLGVAGIFVTT
ncbi:hypothetical protein [Plantactinospora sp. GCM10030261]